ncbi:MAG: isoaspartyl peptidase/L-asparaginase, partial [Spirochaetota bacterium]
CGGYPNILGQIELDASIMNGRTLAAGAVAGLKRCIHAISVARKVMEELPHILLVGEGADRFAEEMGFSKEEPLTDEIRNSYRQTLKNKLSLNDKEISGVKNLRELVRITSDPQRSTETVNFLALDDSGDIASGTSTSGWAWKYPGRVGDSAMIGSGNYADNRYGAATCTGRGEMSIRAGTARAVMLYIKMGMTVREACHEAMDELSGLKDPYFGWVDIIFLSPAGDVYGVTWKKESSIYYMNQDMKQPEKKPKERIPIFRKIPL